MLLYTLSQVCRLAVERSELAPILLFNEADAIIGIRREGATSAVDKMENSIQNIILQEMETLVGIVAAILCCLIATLFVIRSKK